jgi:hypothetical protein
MRAMESPCAEAGALPPSMCWYHATMANSEAALGGVMCRPPCVETKEYRTGDAGTLALSAGRNAQGTVRARSGHDWWHGCGTQDSVAW